VSREEKALACVDVCVYVCVCVCVFCACVRMGVRMCVCVCEAEKASTHSLVLACTYMCIHVPRYRYIRVCTYPYIYNVSSRV